MENEISPCSKDEADGLPSMCEIRFDCFVKMYDMGVKKQKLINGFPFSMRQEKPRPPQWFRSMQKLSLEAIMNSDEYTIGRMIKDQFMQLKTHIQKYENDK